MNHAQDLETRIVRLQRQNKILAIALPLVAAGLFVAAQRQPTVRAKEFILEDDAGNVIARLGRSTDRLKDGKVDITLTGLTIFDRTSKQQVFLGFDDFLRPSGPRMRLTFARQDSRLMNLEVDKLESELQMSDGKDVLNGITLGLWNLPDGGQSGHLSIGGRLKGWESSKTMYSFTDTGLGGVMLKK